jgi:hypothetical protein
MPPLANAWSVARPAARPVDAFFGLNPIAALTIRIVYTF